jgi:hypothetical protein
VKRITIFFGVSVKKSFFGKKILVKIFTLFVILNFNIFAETYTWNGSVSSDWKDARNWDTTDSTPGYNIVLAHAGNDVDFSTRNRKDFDSLVVEEGVSIEINSDITVTNAFTNNGTVTVSDSGITISCGSIENRGSFNFASNSVNCGDLQNRGTLTFTGNLDVTNNATFTRDFTNEGTINVSKNYSDILLLTDINSKIPAQTLKTHEKIILSGTNKNYLEISFFNSKEPFFLNDDLVFTLGDSNIIPDGLYIGKIKEINGKFIVQMGDTINQNSDILIITPKRKADIKSAL